MAAGEELGAALHEEALPPVVEHSHHQVLEVGVVDEEGGGEGKSTQHVVSVVHERPLLEENRHQDDRKSPQNDERSKGKEFVETRKSQREKKHLSKKFGDTVGFKEEIGVLFGERRSVAANLVSSSGRVFLGSS